MKFERYGRTWYTTEAEIISIIKPGENINFDKGLNAYCIEPKKKSIWEF
ncbi:MAG: hypothetical protein KAS66_13575 [Candidatus Omnitrophica bacterium]|nr:hypothetical protein [Candidatus Omnitrophota bacterium]